jgi:DNA-binding response OmpR family regulator
LRKVRDTGLVRVLVVDDDEAVRSALTHALHRDGYEVSTAGDGATALATMLRLRHDAVVLDVLMPEPGGLEVCRAIRARGDDTPILMLTARDLVSDRVAGLDAGADDYLVKPFSLSVLLARLRAHLRRRVVATPPPEPVHLADLVLDVSARRCTLHDEEVPLRPKEFDLLAVLAQHPGEAVSRETLMAEVWDENWFGSTKTLDVTMAGLRRHLTEAADTSAHTGGLPRITTLRGHGYRLEL